MTFPASAAGLHILCHSREETRLKVPDPPARDLACDETFAIQSIFDSAPGYTPSGPILGQADGKDRCILWTWPAQMLYFSKFARDLHHHADPWMSGMTRRQLPCCSNH
jgi:hypothetical protein